MIRAKFTVTNVTQTEVTLLTVTYGSEENEKFFELTPYGSIKMGTINPDAIKQFEVGKEFYVDFTPVK